eukprot:scaffold305402_cov18-Tisochrysis_lutea.AAC.1
MHTPPHLVSVLPCASVPSQQYHIQPALPRMLSGPHPEAPALGKSRSRSEKADGQTSALGATCHTATSRTATCVLSATSHTASCAFSSTSHTAISRTATYASGATCYICTSATATSATATSHSHQCFGRYQSSAINN